MAFTRSGVRSPSPPLNSRVGEVGEVGEVGAVETRPTERLDLAAARGNSSVGRAQPCQGWGRGFESRFPLSPGLTPGPWLEDTATRGGAVWKLAGLITRRSWVQIPPPLLLLDAQGMV